VVSGPIAFLGHRASFISSIIIIQLYGQCLVSLTIWFVYRYQHLFSESRINFLTRRVFAALFVCKLCLMFRFRFIKCDEDRKSGIVRALELYYSQ
jgi:hypothetical protein